MAIKGKKLVVWGFESMEFVTGDDSGRRIVYARIMYSVHGYPGTPTDRIEYSQIAANWLNSGELPSHAEYNLSIPSQYFN